MLLAVRCGCHEAHMNVGSRLCLQTPKHDVAEGHTTHLRSKACQVCTPAAERLNLSRQDGCQTQTTCKRIKQDTNYTHLYTQSGCSQ